MLIDKVRLALKALKDEIDLYRTRQAEILMSAVASSIIKLDPLEGDDRADPLSKVLTQRKKSLGLADAFIDLSETLEYLIALTTYDEGGGNPAEYNPNAKSTAEKLFESLDQVLAHLVSQQARLDDETAT